MSVLRYKTKHNRTWFIKGSSTGCIYLFLFLLLLAKHELHALQATAISRLCCPHRKKENKKKFFIVNANASQRITFKLSIFIKIEVIRIYSLLFSFGYTVKVSTSISIGISTGISMSINSYCCRFALFTPQ